MSERLSLARASSVGLRNSCAPRLKTRVNISLAMTDRIATPSAPNISILAYSACEPSKALQIRPTPVTSNMPPTVAAARASSLP